MYLKDRGFWAELGRLVRANERKGISPCLLISILSTFVVHRKMIVAMMQKKVFMGICHFKALWLLYVLFSLNIVPPAASSLSTAPLPMFKSSILYLSRAHSAFKSQPGCHFSWRAFHSSTTLVRGHPCVFSCTSSIFLLYGLSQGILLSKNLRPLERKLLEAGILPFSFEL